MAAVMIGAGPHRGSHTAVAIGTAEEVLGQLRVRASAAQAGRLLAWAKSWPERTWAVEGAGVWGTCCPSSWSPPGSTCWTCRPSWPPGSGCWQART
jgi:hypothetical protein